MYVFRSGQMGRTIVYTTTFLTKACNIKVLVFEWICMILKTQLRYYNITETLINLLDLVDMVSKITLSSPTWIKCFLWKRFVCATLIVLIYYMIPVASYHTRATLALKTLVLNNIGTVRNILKITKFSTKCLQ